MTHGEVSVSRDGFYVGDKVEDCFGNCGHIVAIWNPGNSKYHICCVKYIGEGEVYAMVPEHNLTRI